MAWRGELRGSASRRRLVWATLATALVVGSSACSTADDSGTSNGAYPKTVTNCGDDVEIPSSPERIVLLTATDVGFLAELDALDLVVGKAGAYPTDYYDEETNATVADVPVLSSRLDDKAAIQISDEVILQTEPDLVLDQVRTDRFTGLTELGIPVLNDEAMCPEGITDPGFEAVYEQMLTYGRVLDREDEAEVAIDRLEQRVATARDQIPESENRTAAILYPAQGSAPTAYGNRSMAAAIVEEAGFTNVFDDLDLRRTEVGAEELISRDPDIIILLHVDGTGTETREALTSLPAAKRLKAVRNGDVMTMRFNFAEPPTPTTVDGLEKIIDRFGDDS